MPKKQIASLTKAANTFGYNILATPAKVPDGEVLKNILSSKAKKDIANAIKDLPFDLSAPTDDRPFFFNQALIQKPLQVIKQASDFSIKKQNLRGHAIATLNLYINPIFGDWLTLGFSPALP